MPDLSLLEAGSRFSASPLWDLQRHYFSSRGVAAWRDGEVPHYITNNLSIADRFAQIAFAFWHDRRALGPMDRPITIIELGAGSGRFAFHFLSRLARLCAASGMSHQAFRYVMTDAADSNLDFWRGHPRLQSWFEDGTLDLALLDATQPGTLRLASGDEIAPGSLAQPPMVIANYLFDSIPQDLFRLSDGALYECLVTPSIDQQAPDPTEPFAGLTLQADYAPARRPAYPEPWLEALMDFYAGALRDTHLLVPAAGLRCLDYLARLSTDGLFLLSADKGDHLLDRLEGLGLPVPAQHGSLSLPVNYHAFLQVCGARGGWGLVPNHPHRSIDVIGLLLLRDAAAHGLTRAAYDRHVADFGPDDCYVVINQARAHIPDMSADEILAQQRLFLFDADHFMRVQARLLELAEGLSPGQRMGILQALDQVWAGYFPLGEEGDLAEAIAELLYALGEPAAALVYFERSMEIYGVFTGTLFNMAACLCLLNRPAEAADLLRQVLLHDPDNAPARALLDECAAG